MVVGDVHLKTGNQQLVEKLFTKISELIPKNDVRRVIFLGDIYNQRSVVRTEQQRILVRGMAKIIKTGCAVDIVVGNHDYDSLETTDTHSLDVLNWLFKQNNVNIHHKFTLRRDEGLESLGLEKGFLFVPYTKNISQLMEQLNQTDADYAFCHVPVSGFWLTPFHKEVNGAATDWFNVRRTVFVGHFHMQQQEGNFVYPGSTFVNSFAEAGMRPHLVIVDTETNDMTYIDLKTEIPEISLYQVEKVDADTWQEPTEAQLADYQGNAVRFIIEGETLDRCKAVKERMTFLTKGRVTNSQFQYKTTKMTQERMPENLSIEDMFLRYIGSRLFENLSPALLEGMKKTGLKYIENFYAHIQS